MKKGTIPVLEIAHLTDTTDNLKNDFAISDTSEDIQGITLEHPVKMNSMFFGICVKGKGRVQLNLGSFDLSERSVVALSPSTIIQYNSKEISSDFLIKYMSFSLEFISAFDAGYLYPDVQQISFFEADSQEYELLLKLYTDLLEKYNNKNGMFRRQIIQHTLLSAMYEFSAIEHNHMTPERKDLSKQERLIWNFYQLLFNNYKEHHDTDFYAQKLFLSSKYLSVILKEQTGKSVNDWVFDYIIIEAKALLKSSQITIQELAYYFNYADATSFGKFFKKQVGMTPKEYRLL